MKLAQSKLHLLLHIVPMFFVLHTKLAPYTSSLSTDWTALLNLSWPFIVLPALECQEKPKPPCGGGGFNALTVTQSCLLGHHVAWSVGSRGANSMQGKALHKTEAGGRDEAFPLKLTAWMWTEPKCNNRGAVRKVCQHTEQCVRSRHTTKMWFTGFFLI